MATKASRQKNHTANKKQATNTPKPQGHYDIILFGATSFVGQITADYLYTHIKDTPASNHLKLAIAGRSQSKLDKLNKKIGADIATIIANSNDEHSLHDMVSQTRVIISTVGPYDLYGSTLVKVCADLGVDYCDLTGEAQWIKQMIDEHADTAYQSGARIVHSCGFDSIPSDIGVHFLQREALSMHGEPCKNVDMRVKAMKGGASGGTILSMVNIMEKVSKDTKLRKVLMNPYALCPSNTPKVKQLFVGKAIHEPQYGAWTAPFIMAAINTKIVHRSNALKNATDSAGYGSDFTYSEATLMGSGRKGQLKAYAVMGGLGGFTLATGFAPTRKLLTKYMLPKSGDGPSQKEQQNGFFNILFFGETASGKKMTAKVTGDRDPGYGSTAKMLGQAAICLAEDIDKAVKGGFWTPASLFGDKIIPRLEHHAGLTFKIV